MPVPFPPPGYRSGTRAENRAIVEKVATPDNVPAWRFACIAVPFARRMVGLPDSERLVREWTDGIANIAAANKCPPTEAEAIGRLVWALVKAEP